MAEIYSDNDLVWFPFIKALFKQNLTGYLEMDQHIDTGIISHLYAFLRKGDKCLLCFSRQE